MSLGINRRDYMYSCTNALCLLVACIELVTAIPPEPIQKLSNLSSAEKDGLGRTESFSLLSANMETPSSLENVTYTESFTETVGLSTLYEEPGSNAKELFRLATGLGICALLAFLLAVALALVLYQKHVERQEREEEKRNAGNNPPPVPKRPDDDLINGNLNEYSHHPQRDSSTTSSNYIRPEAVRIAMVPRTGASPHTKSRRRDGGEEYYAVVQDSPSTSPVTRERRHSVDDEAAYYMRVLEDGEKPHNTSNAVNQEAENAYYIQVVEGGNQGKESPVEYVNGSLTNLTDADDRPPSPFYGNTESTPKSPRRSDLQTEKEEPVDYVISAIGIAGSQNDSHIYGNTVDTPKRENSDNDYYSRVCTLKKDTHDSSGDSLPNNKTRDSEKQDENEPVYSPSSNAKNKSDASAEIDQIKPKKKSAIYMNIRKYLKK